MAKPNPDAEAAQQPAADPGAASRIQGAPMVTQPQFPATPPTREVWDTIQRRWVPAEE